jgi:hypothetical protein
MIRRCTSPKHTASKYYLGRGITVCERWKRFENFLADMGEGQEGLELERSNNDKGYAPDNCEWATREEQMNNRSNNVLVEYDGETMTVAQAARRFKVNYFTLYDQITTGKPTHVSGLTAINQQHQSHKGEQK